MKYPFAYDNLVADKSIIHLVSYEEFNPLDYTQYLTENEQQRMISFKSISRRMEFTATRILRHKVIGFEQIHYNNNGAPYIKNEGFISISHGKHHVGIAINKSYAIGLDLESQRENILDLRGKFLSAEEKSRFNIDDPKEVTKIWSAKEALYKLAGRKKIHFKSELLLTKENNSVFHGHIVNPDHDLFVKLNNFEHDNTIITINVNKVVKRDRNIRPH